MSTLVNNLADLHTALSDTSAVTCGSGVPKLKKCEISGKEMQNICKIH